MMHTDQSTEQSPSPRIVIVGGVAGGASAAARLRRLDEHASITLIERGADVSFANCGLPYHIGGEIEDRGKLSVQTPASLRAQLAIDVQARTEAISIDRETKTLRIHKLDTDVEEDLGYDKLILSPRSHTAQATTGRHRSSRHIYTAQLTGHGSHQGCR